MKFVKVNKTVSSLNFIPRVPRLIYDHLVDENHSLTHRMFCGFIVMASGVIVSKLGSGMLHYISDLIGYGIHGLGAVPFIDHLVKKSQT